MDAFTQMVLGASVSNAVFGNKIGNKAIVYGVFFGIFPDFDFIFGSIFLDSLTLNEFHRGIMHSILFFIFVSFLFSKILVKRHSQLQFKHAFFGLFLILFTHSLLDIFTTWGTQIFWPFPQKIAIKSIFVIDPLYTIPLFLATLWSFTKDYKTTIRYKINNIGLIVSSLYLVLSVLIQNFVENIYEEDLKKQQIQYTAITVKPTAFNTILWNAIIETKEAFYLSDFSIFQKDKIKYTFVEKKHELMDSLNDNSLKERLINLSENQYVMTKQATGLYFNDLRFGLLNKDTIPLQFGFTYQLKVNNNFIENVIEVKKNRKEGMKMLQKIIKRIKTSKK